MIGLGMGVAQICHLWKTYLVNRISYTAVLVLPISESPRMQVKNADSGVPSLYCITMLQVGASGNSIFNKLPR